MENELYHYGRKGMKWYQNIFTKGKQASAARKQRKAEKEKAAEEKKKLSVEEQKTKIRNSRSAEQVYKNAHLFNDKELNEIYNRLNTENNIKNLIPAKVNKGKKFVDNAATTAKSVSTLVGNATDLYNKVNNVFKLFSKDTPSAKNAGDGKTDDNAGNKGNKGNKSNKPKKEETKSDDKVERVTNFEILDRVAKTASSRSSNKVRDIIDYSDYQGGRPSYDATKLAKSLVNNIGSRTVSSVMNNQNAISSVDNYLLSIGVRRVDP